MRNLKWILLGIYLILAGLALLGVNIGGGIIDIIAGICAVGAGILFLINR
jgi:glucose dehydrogenase